MIGIGRKSVWMYGPKTVPCSGTQALIALGTHHLYFPTGTFQAAKQLSLQREVLPFLGQHCFVQDPYFLLCGFIPIVLPATYPLML